MNVSRDVIRIRQKLCRGDHEQKGCNDGTQRTGLGDRIASIAQPIARTIDKVFNTNVTGCGGCKKAQQRLNAGQPIIPTIIKRLKGE